MANSLYSQLNNSSSNIMNLVQTARNSSNPQQFLVNLAQKDSRVANVLKEVRESGGDPKALFYKKAQQMGIDPNTILANLK